jgi:putative selenate reductase
MAELCPYPIGKLINRMFRELSQAQEIFDLPERKFFRGGDRDLSVRFHDKVAATPLGPAAGPHSQLAQNIVLSFLGGGRIFELKTVQINDRLVIPRPCIDMQTVGYNVEWSQELTLEQSLEEYVKASMLIEILRESGALKLAPGADRVIYDMSVGYDLAGIQSERVGAFLRGMLDATAVVDRLRRQIPEEYRRYRDLDFATRISDTLTLSTFHGCPPDEIERMIHWLLTEVGLHCVVKLNPTLLGPRDAREILNERLGYPDHIPDEAFAKDTTWAQALDFTGRLREVARAAGRGFGVKLSNTLVVENHRAFFPQSERLMYLSGAPLHVLAMNLVWRLRRELGGSLPISFSAGIDRHNFADAVSLGLVPVTVCSDLLRTGGYGRMQPYFADLLGRMGRVGARTIDEWVVLARGQGQGQGQGTGETAELGAAAADPARWARRVEEARVRNTEAYVSGLASDPRYAHAANRKGPPKVGSHLVLFDCLTCDKCVPVCPNDANFTFTLPRGEVPVRKARLLPDGSWALSEGEPLRITQKHQIGTFADFCNECGNCDVFCPEDGGPYLIKPRFFGSLAEWERQGRLDGFYLEREGGTERVWGRLSGRAFSLQVTGEEATFYGEGFAVRCAEGAPEQTLSGSAAGEVDLTYFHILNLLRKAIFAGPGINYLNS